MRDIFLGFLKMRLLALVPLLVILVLVLILRH
jgi:hypothetical protein